MGTRVMMLAVSMDCGLAVDTAVSSLLLLLFMWSYWWNSNDID